MRDVMVDIEAMGQGGPMLQLWQLQQYFLTLYRGLRPGFYGIVDLRDSAKIRHY